MSTRERIVQAATRLYAERGYDGMTMKEIADEVGIKAPSLYAFFASKADIFLQIYQDTIDRHLQVAQAHADDNIRQSVKEQLEGLLRAVIDYQFREAVQMKIYMRLLLFPPDLSGLDLKDKLLEIEKQEAAMLRRLFQKGMERGEIRSGDADAYATSFVCMMDGLFWEMQRYEEAEFRDRFQVIWEQHWQGISLLSQM